MSILLSLLLAQARVLPEIDRRALDLQARAEAIQTRRPATAAPAPRRSTTSTGVATATPLRRAVQQASQQRQPQGATNRPASVRRASGGTLDLAAITTICRAAGNQADPAGFLSTLTRAYGLDGGESQSLRTSCAAYLAGRADARTSNYGAPAH